MSAIKFGNTPTEPAEVADQAQTECEVVNEIPADAKEALQSAPDTGFTTSTALVKRNAIVDDTLPESSEIIVPRVNLVQASGQLKENHIEGSIIYDMRADLYVPGKINTDTGNVERKGTPPLECIFLGHHALRYGEVVPGGGRGIVVNNEAEIRKAGGTLDYDEWKMKEKHGMLRFAPMQDFLLAIAKPEGFADESVFTFPCEGKLFALGIWTLKKSGYTQAVKKVLNYQRRYGYLKDEVGGIIAWSFNVSTRRKEMEGNPYFIPILAPRAKTSEAVREWARDIVNPEAAKASDDDNE